MSAVKVRKVLQYVASDNSLHNSRNEAIRHNNKLEAKQEILNLLKVSLSTMRPDAVIGHMLEDAKQLRNILNKYLRTSRGFSVK